MKTSIQLPSTLLALGLAALPSLLGAREFQGAAGPGGGSGGGGVQGAGLRAAGCAPSTTVTRLWVNNVRTLVETGGIMWENRASGDGSYEVPAPQGTQEVQLASCLFAGSLWMGGFDDGGNLKLAAVRFRQDGNDFWPGPLSNTGDASVTPEVCSAWDKTWSAGKKDAVRQDAYFRCLVDPTCDETELFPEGYTPPSYFFEWPAYGDPTQNQDVYIAPFTDFNGDGEYNPADGDAPDYGLDEDNDDCKNKFREDPVSLFGDSTIWWVFNDKGNAHTESGGQPIGMEIRAQAFAFATNDEVNNMTFYNYVLINQGTQTLEQTYFAQYVDPDLGGANDDYVGCDVQRGLGYCYNGDNDDQDANGAPGYGEQPPAIGVDFFEGPFLDYDLVDNPGPTNYTSFLDCDSARTFNGIPYKGIGIGYGDGVVDNERYGMRAFMYYNNAGGVLGDPGYPDALDHYNYMRAIWKDGSPLLYGGNGHAPTDDPDQDQRALYMAPGDSDPVGWGTECIPQYAWSEETSGNDPEDRRFVQSAGPFTLEPGAYNNITVGVVWARANSGGPFESVERVRKADDKAQSLFDNCFKILDGPDAPLVNIIELDRELVLTITNPIGSNNYNEEYEEIDPTIPETAPDRFYRFQGYQIFQLRDGLVSVADILDEYGNLETEVARIVATVDIEDGIGQIVNYIFNDDIGLPVPTEMVNAPDDGVKHSFSVKNDLFSNTGDPNLVNFKTYYYLVLAYAYNNWEDYDPVALTGQPFRYKAGRKSSTGSIRSYSGIPHKNSPQDFGTTLQAGYGSGFDITRAEGTGNGGMMIDLTQSTIDQILAGPDYRKDLITYRTGMGPVNVKVVDPLSVPTGNFELWLLDSTGTPTFDPDTYGQFDDAYWMLVNTLTGDTVRSAHTISVNNEQLILKWGMSVTVNQMPYSNSDDFADLIDGTIEFGPPGQWFTGIPDQEGDNLLNWIRSGTAYQDNEVIPDRPNVDNDEVYEGLLDGTWAPWPLCGDTAFQPVGLKAVNGRNVAKISENPSVLVVITPDKSKWTRCGVLEMEMDPDLSENGAEQGMLRRAPSLDRNGRPTGSPGCNELEATYDGTQTEGMSWFPGYAISLEDGERLNMAFGENSFWGGTTGRDMMWNPSNELFTSAGEYVAGGCHWIYVFKNNARMMGVGQMPAYDQGKFLYDGLNGNSSSILKVYRGCAWVGSALSLGTDIFRPMDQGLVPGEVRIRINIEKPYTRYEGPAGYTPTIPGSGYSFRNNGLPLYQFNTSGQATLTAQTEVAETACDLMDIVPNPYYAFSGYETSRLDNRVKFINLPQVCTISIYNVSGTLVRKFRKDNGLTYLDWDLKNQVNVPIAGGVYLCHIEVPGVCERVVKFFGVMRPVDLQNF